MDEITEVKRIWEQTEARLASMNGDQERKYTVYFPDGRPVETIMISANADEDEVISSLIEVGYLRSDGDYLTYDTGADDKITIEESFNDETNEVLTLKTNEEIEDFDQFMENVLDIERTQYLSSGQWITKEYTIVTGTGGPHVEFTTGYSIHVYWGGQVQEFTTYNDQARATIDRIEEYLNEIYGSE